MSNTLFQSLLTDLIKANKARKLKLAQKAGYSSVEEYKTMLETEIGIPQLKEKPTIHIVDIIDCSASMAGTKIRNAVEGINSGIEKLRKDKEVIYTYTLCDFSYSNDINFSHKLSNISQVGNVNFTDRGMTALRDAIGTTLTLMKQNVKNDNDKVLVNIYTDGGENGSVNYTQDTIAEMIKDLQNKNYTITFIGTTGDVAKVIQNYNVHASNTMSYDGSARGLQESLRSTENARSLFASKVLKGEDVKMGFYKDVN